MATTTTPYRSTVPGGRDGFGRLLLAEWTKLRSVPRWGMVMLAAVALTVLVGALTEAGAVTATVNDDGGGTGGTMPGVQDQGHFVHQPLSGDGTLSARVATQAGSHEWAKAGLMIRETSQPGSPYAAVMVTPEHGVRLQSNFTLDAAGGSAGAPRWLKLTRSGTSITGYESADGSSWTQVGSVELDGLPETAEIGLFVASPDRVRVERQFGGETIDARPTDGKATFDNVRFDPEQPQQSITWGGLEEPDGPGDGGATEAGGTYTLTGSGDVGRDEFADDVTERALSGVLVGLMAVVALAVLFITSEYKRGMIQTTFAASPRRGRVLVAKAVVVGACTFAAGLVASFGAFLISQAVRSGGAAPALSEWPVLRAVVGTAALLAVIAVFSLAVATVLRHSAAAITAVLLLLLVPQIVATGLPLSAAMWLERLTPSAGFAIQQTVQRYDTALGPWAGLGVLCGYTVVGLAVAVWRLRRRDA